MTPLINDELRKGKGNQKSSNTCICIFCFARIETLPPFFPKRLDPTIQNMKEIARIFHHGKHNVQIPNRVRWYITPLCAFGENDYIYEIEFFLLSAHKGVMWFAKQRLSYTSILIPWLWGVFAECSGWITGSNDSYGFSLDLSFCIFNCLISC